MAFTNSAIGSTNTEIYLSSGSNAVVSMIVCNKIAFDSGNPTANQTNLYLYAVPNGATLSDIHLIINGVPVPAGETITFDQEKLVMATGDRIIARSDVPANLVATVSYLPA